jgi:hypothetical protein
MLQRKSRQLCADFVAEVARENGLSCRSGFSKVDATCSCRSLQSERRL